MKHGIVDVVAKIVGIQGRFRILARKGGSSELEQEFERCSRTGGEGEAKFEDGRDEIAESIGVAWT